MKIYILQYRIHGEDYQAAAFRTREKAQLTAFNFLQEVCGDCVEHEFTVERYEALAEHCYCNDIAYIEITTYLV